MMSQDELQYKTGCNFNKYIFKTSEKSNGRIDKWLKFLSSLSVLRNRSLNFTLAFFCRFKDLEPMLHGMTITNFILICTDRPFRYPKQESMDEETLQLDRFGCTTLELDLWQ